MKLALTIIILLTACTTTTESLIPCAEIEVTARHMEFLLQSCIQKVHTECEDSQSDCGHIHVLKCFERDFSLKLVQVRAYRIQKCWQLHAEQQ